MAKKPYFTVTEHSFDKNSGYKNTAAALAEIVDNSAEEDANNISIIIKEVRRPSKHISAIGILDDGNGMTPDIIQSAICERSGTRHDRMRGSGKGKGRRKFGKYGVGLPKASIYSADKFTVWSWQKSSSKKAFRNGIDINDKEWIAAGAQVDESVQEAAPSDWIKLASHGKSESGTFVLWEDLTNLTWKWAQRGESGFIPRIQFLLGRAYRKLIVPPEAGKSVPKLNISIIVCDDRMAKVDEVPVVVNDPLYLTPNTGCPEPTYLPDWKKGTPLFEEINSVTKTVDFKVEHDGEIKSYDIAVRGSVATKDAKTVFDNRNPGSQPHGKHAAKNQGISFLREGRELCLDTRWISTYDSRERWWGLEIDFPHELDRAFGVTADKQGLEGLLQKKHSEDDIKEGSESAQSALARLRKEGNVNYANCIDLCWKIDKWVATLRNMARVAGPEMGLKKDKTGKKKPVVTKKKGGKEKAEVIATDPDKNKVSDKEIALRDKEVKAYLKDCGVPANAIKDLSDRMVSSGLNYLIVERPNLGSALFTVDEVRDAKIITLNQGHKAYEYLINALKYDPESSGEDLQKQMESTNIAIHLLIEAWAKCEAECKEEEEDMFLSCREDWGRALSVFISNMHKYSDD